jgi:transposase
MRRRCPCGGRGGRTSSPWRRQASACRRLPSTSSRARRACVRRWIERFNAAGLDGLDDAARAGRPRTYPEDAYSRMIAKARGLPPKPADAEVPATCHWTLDRLHAELAKDGLSIKRSPIRRIRKAEHLKWQKPRTGLERTDPDFAEKRGALLGSLPIRRPAAR